MHELSLHSGSLEEIFSQILAAVYNSICWSFQGLSIMSASMFEYFDKDSLLIISSTSCISIAVLELS